MFKSRVLALCGLGLLCALGFSGCSGSSAITITLSPTTTPTINQGQTQAITASLTNDKNSQGVTWSLSGVGSLSNQTTTSVTYIAPTSLAADTTVTITATSVADTSVTATLSITIDAIFGFTTTSLPVGTFGVPYNEVVTVTGASGPFTWAITSGSLPAGLTLSNSTTASVTIIGTPTATGTTSFTLQSTDGAGTVISETLNITINPAPPLSVATRSPLPSGTVGTAYSYTLQASSGTPPYSWTTTTGAASLPAGLSLSTTTPGLISGTPTTAGSSNFTVEVTDSSTPNPQTASANLTLTISPSVANDTELNGNYAFLLSGFNNVPSPAYYASAGSFFANGQGNITNGIIDVNNNGVVPGSQAFSGTYAIGTNQLGTMSLPGIGRTFAFTLTADGNSGKIIEFDSTGIQASGVLLKQTTSAFGVQFLDGNYAFGMSGVDASGGRYGFAGAFNADGAGAFGNGNNAISAAADSDDAGTLMTNVACSGTYTIPSASTTGRGTASIIIGGQTTNYAFYVVSASQLLFLETDTGTNPRVSGSMVAQSGPALSGTSVFETTAFAPSGPTAIGQVGLLVASSGSLTMSSNENSAGTMSQPSSSLGASYVVASNGRTTLSGSGISGTPTNDPVLYLSGVGQGFIIGIDDNVTFGLLEAQQQPAMGFAAASLNGTYAGGSIAPIDSNGNNEIDSVTSNGVSSLTFNTDSSNSSSGLVQNQTPSAVYNITGTNGAGTQTGSSTGNTGFIYMVSPTEFYYLNSTFTTGSDVNAMIEDFVQ